MPDTGIPADQHLKPLRIQAGNGPETGFSVTGKRAFSLQGLKRHIGLDQSRFNLFSGQSLHIGHGTTGGLGYSHPARVFLGG